MTGKVRDSIVPNAIHIIEPETVTDGDIDSGTATAGQVLQADGSGGADWDDLEVGDIDSGTETAGKVMTADGSGGASWEKMAPFYLGTNAGQTLTLGTLFAAAAGRAHALGDFCCYLDSVAGAYRLCMATGTGASDFVEFVAVIP